VEGPRLGKRGVGSWETDGSAIVWVSRFHRLAVCILKPVSEPGYFVAS
jgi:hypothetical protein